MPEGCLVSATSWWRTPSSLAAASQTQNGHFRWGVQAWSPPISAGQAEPVREAFVESVRLQVQSETDRAPLTDQLLALLPWCSDSDIQLLISLAARLGSSASRRVVSKQTDGPSTGRKPEEDESQPHAAGKSRGSVRGGPKVPPSKAEPREASGAPAEPPPGGSRAR